MLSNFIQILGAKMSFKALYIRTLHAEKKVKASFLGRKGINQLNLITKLLKRITYLSLIKYKLIKLKLLNLAPNTFVRMKERLRCTAGASSRDQLMKYESVSLTWLSNAFYWLSTFLSMTHTLSFLVRFQTSRKTIEKTQPRRKSG